MEKKVYILGAGSELPGKPVTNEDMSRVFGIQKAWIDKMVGNEHRYFAADLHGDGQDYSLENLATKAGIKALENADVRAEDIDAILLSTATPDELMPATVNMVADTLGCGGIPTYQVQAGCSGAVQAIDLAVALLQSRFKTVLVIGADSCRKHFDLGRDPKTYRSHELINICLFGDGAGAAVLSSNGSDGAIEILDVMSRFNGLGKKPGQIIRWFGLGEVGVPAKRLEAANEDYKAIAKDVPVISKEILLTLLAKQGWTLDEVEHFLPPQLSGLMTQQICKQLDIPDSRAINCVAQTGNNGNALPYLQIECLFSTIKPGEKAVLIAVESSKWVETGLNLKRSA